MDEEIGRHQALLGIEGIQSLRLFQEIYAPFCRTGVGHDITERFVDIVVIRDLERGLFRATARLGHLEL